MNEGSLPAPDLGGPVESATPSTDPTGWVPATGPTVPLTYWGDPDPTPPPPPRGTAYAGVGRRFVALLIDLIPLTALALVLYVPLGVGLFDSFFRALPDGSRTSRLPVEMLQSAMSEAMVASVPGLLRVSALFQVGALIYFTGSWLAFSRSPGMAVMRIRIVREEDGGRLDPGRVAVRYGGFMLSTFSVLIGFAWAIFDRRKQAWQDKLAGTLVVRGTSESGWDGYSDRRPAFAPSAGEAVPESSDVAPTRPSIGALAETAWATLRRSGQGLIRAQWPWLALTLVGLAVPMVAYMAACQDQSVATVRAMDDLFRGYQSSGDLLDYNLDLLAAGLPALWIGAVMVFVSAVLATIQIAAGVTAVDANRSIRTAAAVARDVVARLPALLVLGIGGGIALVAGTLLLGIPSILAADRSTVLSPMDLSTVGAATALGFLVLVPAGIYAGIIWVLAIPCVMAENLGPTAALRRAWQLSRRRMTWLAGISISISLVCALVIGPIAGLPTGLLAEAYVAGDRLPVVLSAVLIGLSFLITFPVTGLVYREAYLAARDNAPGRATG